MSVTLTVTAKGQVTLRKEVLEHMGVRPGDRIDVDFVPAGRVQLRARSKQPIAAIFGMIEKPDDVSASIEDIDEAIAAGWAGEK